MAIEPLRLAAAALCMSLACGCGPVLDRCKPGTLVVAVALDSATVAADELVVAVALDGGPAQATSLTHTPGAQVGNVVVQFPRGYPQGSVVSVVVTARAGGAVVGLGRATATLSGACQATTLAVAAAADDAGSADDLGADLGASDLSTADLAPPPPDLRPPPPDLYCPGGGTELCFNGIDDDCDGLADCADPDCAPVATCVPSAPAPFVYGTEEPAGGSCPTATTATTMYQADGMGGGCASSCSCAASGCSATLTGIVPCPGGTPQSTFATLTHGSCQNIEDQINFRISPITGTLSCNTTGSAAPVTPPVLTTALECAMSGSVVQGGCGVGQVCVARGTKQCVRATGSGVTCPASYPTAVNWFASYTDNRTCTCSCGNSGCAAASVAFFDSKSCVGTAVPESGDICSNGLLGAKLVNGCSLSVTFANPLQFNNASTVCCP